MTELSVEHVLLFVVAAFLLYYLIGSCGCRNGFRVGGQFCEITGLLKMSIPQKLIRDGSCPKGCAFCNCCTSPEGGGDNCDFGCIDPH